MHVLMKPMLGLQFGRLTVVALTSSRKPGQGPMWECLCECGNRRVVSGGSLRRGSTRSCGCLHDEGNHKTHGGTHERLFQIWAAMRARCRDTNRRDSKYYSDKGIKVCSEWEQYETFKAWALCTGYAENLTIDMIDSSKGYSPDNCQWITMGENSRKAHLGISHKVTQSHRSGGLNATQIG